MFCLFSSCFSQEIYYCIFFTFRCCLCFFSFVSYFIILNLSLLITALYATNHDHGAWFVRLQLCYLEWSLLLYLTFSKSVICFSLGASPKVGAQKNVKFIVFRCNMTLLSHLREINNVRKVKRLNKLVCEWDAIQKFVYLEYCPWILQLIKYSWFRNSTPEHQPDQGLLLLLLLLF